MRLSFQSNSTINLLCGLWKYIGKKRKWQFQNLLLLMVFSGFAEMLSIGMVVPFFTALLTPEILNNNNFISTLFGVLGANDLGSQVICISIIFIVAALISGAARIFLLHQSGKIIFSTGADLSAAIYSNVLQRPYLYHLETNTSEIIDAVSNKANIVIFDILVPVINIISSTIILISIVSILLFLNPIPAIVSFILIGTIYIAVMGISKKKLKNNSEVTARESIRVIKLLQEGLGGIRDIIVDQNQHIYTDLFEKTDRVLRNMQSQKQFIAYSPRYLVETILLVFLSLAISFIGGEKGVAGAIPTLGALVLGAQRMLPVLQQGYTGWAHIKASHSALKEVTDLLKPNSHGNEGVPKTSLYFHDFINLQEVGFSFPNGISVLNKVTFEIGKGEWIGIIGVTGSGKSTLLDILMGLLQPNYGSVKIDGVSLGSQSVNSWQKLIAHVPQTIFLKDGSVLENIAFGQSIEDINIEEVIEAAKLAQIHDDVNNWPAGYMTIVGERGVRISGGQRQRIGLARAFYKKAEVLILDEATSALDSLTEGKVMKAIQSQGSRFTCIIVAHRLTTLRCCTKIIELNKGEITRVGDYNSIVI